MDIIFSDGLKRDMRILLWFAKRKLKKDHGVTITQMIDDLDNCGNPVIANIWREIKESSNQINQDYQKNIALEFPAIIMWIIYKDTAYSPIFFYVLTNIMRKSEKLLPLAEQYRVEPIDWYVNRWNESIQHSDKLKKEGIVAPVEGMMSPDEMIFVPQYQQQIVDKLTKSYEKEIDDEREKMRNKKRVFEVK